VTQRQIWLLIQENSGHTHRWLQPTSAAPDFHLAYEAVQIEDYMLHFRPFKQRSNFSHDFAGCLAIADDPFRGFAGHGDIRRLLISFPPFKT
jgi:hypothetical protein